MKTKKFDVIGQSGVLEQQEGSMPDKTDRVALTAEWLAVHAHGPLSQSHGQVRAGGQCT